MKYEAVRLGAKYAGKCVVCGNMTGDRKWELGDTVLVKDDTGNWGVCHASCCPACRKRMKGYVLEGKAEFTA